MGQNGALNIGQGGNKGHFDFGVVMQDLTKVSRDITINKHLGIIFSIYLKSFSVRVFYYFYH